MMKRVCVIARIIHVLKPIQLAAIAMRTRSNARLTERSGNNAFSTATNNRGATCATVLNANSSATTEARSQFRFIRGSIRNELTVDS